MNENEGSDLAALARLVSTAYPSIISAKERDAFIAACTIHHEVAAAKGESNQPEATAAQSKGSNLCQCNCQAVQVCDGGGDGGAEEGGDY